jgi:hypothetical protein
VRMKVFARGWIFKTQGFQLKTLSRLAPAFAG